jgi:hypothetical protein
MFRQPSYNLRNRTAGESVILPKFHRPSRTVQIEYSLVPAPDHMHMGGPVIVWIDNNAQPAKPENRRQKPLYICISQALGFSQHFPRCGRSAAAAVGK